VGRSASGPRLRRTGGAAPRRPGMIRVLLADDQTLIRRRLRSLLDSEPDIEVVGEAGDGGEAVALARPQSPQLILMDIRTPRPARPAGSSSGTPPDRSPPASPPRSTCSRPASAKS